MKRISWACFSVCFAALVFAVGGIARSQVLMPRQADVLFSASVIPPPTDAQWKKVELPLVSERGVAWSRVRFEMAAPVTDEAWAVYLPYLYGGGRLILNGTPLTYIQEPAEDVIVRWERPHLIAIPASLLRPGVNELFFRIQATPTSRIRLPLLSIGPHVKLLANYETRLFWVRTMSQFTVVSCLIIGILALVIWGRRSEETLYGLFGAAALLWGVRTMTLVIEVMPAAQWHAWRTLYHGATGGFVVVMLLFSMCLAGIPYPRLKWWLLAYWLVGPLAYLASGGNELLVGRFWAGGLLPMGLAILVISGAAAWRHRTPALVALSLALAVAVLAGLHDYLISMGPPALLALAPQAMAHRIFLLHYAADLLLLVMGGVLTARFIRTLKAIRELNRTLESRVAEREALLAANYARVRNLERQHAAGEERQKIMRDLHDGLGSQLFLTLSNVEAGQIDQKEIVQALRACIADMRLTFEAMSPQSNDFLQAWGNFRFRWQQLLESSGVTSTWELDAPEQPLEMSAHTTLQLLRIAQEGLTNAMKHSRARTVAVRLRTQGGALAIEICDDGCGLRDAHATRGRGLANMRTRARGLGARLDIADRHPGVRILVELDLGAPV